MVVFSRRCQKLNKKLKGRITFFLRKKNMVHTIINKSNTNPSRRGGHDICCLPNTNQTSIHVSPPGGLSWCYMYSVSGCIKVILCDKYII